MIRVKRERQKQRNWCCKLLCIFCKTGEGAADYFSKEIWDDWGFCLPPKIPTPAKENSRAWAWVLQQNIMGLSFEHTQLILKHTQKYVLCVIANFLFSGLIIVIKVSIEKGCSCYVLLSYGEGFGALTTGDLALLYERFPSIFSLLLIALSYYLGTNLLFLHFLFPYKIFSCLSVHLGGWGWIPDVSIGNTNSSWKYQMMPMELQDFQ